MYNVCFDFTSLRGRFFFHDVGVLWLVKSVAYIHQNENSFKFGPCIGSRPPILVTSTDVSVALS